MKDVSVMIDDVRLNYRVGLLILKDDKVLLEISPKYKFAVIPGGRVKTLESTKDTLIRELNEEMHIDISNENIELCAYIENFFEFENKKNHELYVVYKLIVKDNKFDDASINYDSDSNYYEWVSINELDNIKILPVVLKDLINSNSFKHIIVKDLEK